MHVTRKGEEDKRFKLTDEEVKEAHAILMENDQLQVSELAKQLDVSAAGLYYRFEILNLEKPRRRRTINRDIEIAKAKTSGTPVKELMKTYGCSKPAIYAALRRSKQNGVKHDGRDKEKSETAPGKAKKPGKHSP